MSGKAAKIQLTNTMYQILQRLARSRTLGNSIILRAKIILAGFDQATNQEIAARLGLGPKTGG